MDTRGELRTKAKVSFVLAGLFGATIPYLAIAEMPPTQHGGRSNGFLVAIAAILALLSLGIGFLDRHQARSAPEARPALAPERQAAARHDLRLLMGGKAILMTVVAAVLAVGGHVAMAMLSLLSAVIFAGIAVSSIRGSSS